MSYKNKKVIRHSPDQLRIFEDTQPAIISCEDFARTQELPAKSRRVKPIEETEFTLEVMSTFIDRIEVYEEEKIPKSRLKSWKIKIFFNGIGALDQG